MSKSIKRSIIFAFFLLIAVSSLFAQNWQLVWQDEFNYTGLPDPNKWGYDVGAGGWGNGEAQYYSNARRENSRVENGNLILEARRDWAGAEYSSARLVSRGKGDWLYGRIEIRAKIPVGQGLWPALWMLPTDWAYGGWPASGEIDIMESFALGGLKYDKVEANIHTQAYNHTIGTNKGAPITGLSNIEQNYHVYRVTWYANRMVFDVDGREYFTFNNEGTWQKWPYDKRFHLIMNIAVGGSLGTWIDPNIFPKRMEVDYVRVYQDNGTVPSTTGVVTAYRDCNYAAQSAGLAVGDYTLAQIRALGLNDNDISSLRITQGFEAVLYEHDNFGGISTLINSDNSCLNTTWNDAVSSIRIRTNGATNLAGTYYLQNRNSGLNMDVTGGVGATGDGANIQQWNVATTANQQFQFTHLGDGTYKILAMHSMKSIDVDGIKMNNGANVQQWTYYGTPNQQFVMVPAGDGYYKMIAKHSGKMVEVAGANTAPEANVQQWTNNNQTCGMWKLVPIQAVNGNGDGLTANYFNGMNFETPKISRKDATVNFSWNNGTPDASVNADAFSARWTGQIQPRYSGEYTFYINSDNGRRLWINNQLIIDKWIDDWGVDYSGKITLTAGQKYNIKLEYFENVGGANCKLEWSSALQNREVVPQSQLYANPLPGVNITSPANNANFNAPASIAINATASDNASVSKVDFYNGATLLGSDNSSPYSFTWNNVAAGTYSITARVTDNMGAVTVSSTVSVIVKTVVITQSPYGGTPWIIPGKIEAENFDLGGHGIAYSDVDVSNNGGQYRTSDRVDIEISTDAGTGHNVGWTAATEWMEYTVNVNASGNYNLSVRVAATASGKSFHVEMDGSNISGVISVPNTGGWQIWQTVTINNIALTAGQKIMRIVMDTDGINLNYVNFASTGVVGDNQAPVVSVTSPLNNSAYNAPASITINATASDADGTVSKVDFYNGAVFLGSDNTSPYSYTWSNVGAGTYSVTAKATDNSSAVTTSSSVSVKVTTVVVNQPPSVSITSPASNASFTAPASISITASASDADGSITKVEFFNGGQKLGEDAVPPYSYSWTGVAAGTYTISAKANDNTGASVTSSSVTITVTPSTIDNCTGISQYIENNGYVAGSKVKSSGRLYECKEWPYSGWCNGAAWAYSPGSGAYWQDAWYDRGSCTSAKMANGISASYKETITIAPNPVVNELNLQTNFDISGGEIRILNSLGIEVLNMHSTSQVDVSLLPPGVYTLLFTNNGSFVTQTFIK